MTTKDQAIRHCIACCDGTLTDEQRQELYSRIGGAIEAEREACIRIAIDYAIAAAGHTGEEHAAERIAALIRNRGEGS